MNTTLGEQLRAARKAAGLTLAQVCARTEINISTLSQIENGYIKGTLKTLEKLASTYDMQIVVSLLPRPTNAGGNSEGDVFGEGENTQLGGATNSSSTP